MAICNIEEILKEINKGCPIILIDDENRENEGDLVIAAEKVTPEIINFMAKNAKGLICLAMNPELIDRLNLPLMVQNNTSRFHSNFTVSIEARYGISTGISAFDRAKTILAAVNDNAKPDDLVYPGHIFPLRAESNGVLVRNGHTEGSVDLAKLAGLKPAAVMCEIMKDDGTMARLSDLEKFAEIHNLKIASIKDLISYRLRCDKSLIKRIVTTKIPTDFGEFDLIAYESLPDSSAHLALVKGKIDSNASILIRIHSRCLTGDVFNSKRCDCGQQLQYAMHTIAEEGNGVILYMDQEGRGIGLSNKIRAYALQDQGIDTVDANIQLGFETDHRDYGIAAQILLDLGISKVRMLTNNPNKITALESTGLKVERVPINVKCCKENVNYLRVKKTKMGHLLNLNCKEEKLC
jgi:3,4-dihydroxy 2-butanone 4-phosphate synthase/GTP cyclohydrolase II